MQQHTQELLALGVGIILAALAGPNIKAFATGTMHLIRSPEKHAVIDRSRVKPYGAWLAGTGVLAITYNFIITQDPKLFGEATVLDLFLLAVGLMPIILYKKEG